jgi:hypothetical protein
MRHLLILVFFMLSACTNNDRIPDDIIGKEKMERILWDMIQADRFSTQFLAKDSAKLDVKKETFILYDQVFQVNKVTKDQFIKSYKYYLSRPDITKVIFDSLATRANRRKEAVYEKKMVD